MTKKGRLTIRDATSRLYLREETAFCLLETDQRAMDDDSRSQVSPVILAQKTKGICKSVAISASSIFSGLFNYQISTLIVRLT